MPPNILLVICDQLRAFETGCYGNPVIRTPNLDRLALEGLRFETAVSTFPVCMAARSVLLSGQYNRTCTGGVGNVSIPGRPGDFIMPEYPEAGRPHLPDTTLAEALHSRGYHTAAIGKWHIHSWPDEVGFDDFLIPRVHHCHSAQAFSENGGPEFVPPGYSVDYEAGRAVQFLQAQRGRSQPFFLYYSISPPHNPLLDAPEKYTHMYRVDEIPLRPNVDLSRPLADQDYWFRVYRWDFRYYNLHLPYTQPLPADYDLRQLIAGYYGLTTWVDDVLGQVLAALEENGLAQDTIVLFTSDHGDSLGSLGLVQKGTPNEEAVRVPLVVRWPGQVPAGMVNRSQAAGLVDLAPSLLGLSGGEVPACMQGRDLHIGAENDTPDHAVIETGSGVGVRTLTHLYYLPWAESGRSLAARPTFFYDLHSDPYQMHNLAGSGEQPETAARLDSMLRAWDRATPWMAPH